MCFQVMLHAHTFLFFIHCVLTSEPWKPVKGKKSVTYTFGILKEDGTEMGDVQKMLVGFQSFKGRMMVDMVICLIL